MRLFLLLFLCIFSYTTYGQVTQVVNHFYANQFVYNPSFAGIDDRGSFYFNHHQQWLGVDGAPAVSSLSFHSPVGYKNFSMGVNIMSDKRSLLSFNSALLTVAYHLKVSNNSDLRFGMSAGAMQTRLDFSRIPNPNDNALIKQMVNTIYPDAQAGLSYFYKKFNIGIALPYLIKSNHLNKDIEREFAPFSALNLTSSYSFTLNHNLDFVPTIAYRKTPEREDFTEAAAIFNYKNLLWGGINHKRIGEFGVLGGIRLQDKYSFAYSYVAGQKLMASFGGIHEVQLNIQFGERRDKKFKVIEYNLNGEDAVRPRFLNESEEERRDRLISLEKEYYYLVYSVHKEYNDTERSVLLLRRKKLQGEVGYNVITKTYVVYVYKTKNMSEALKVNNKLKRKKKLKNLKIMTVN